MYGVLSLRSHRVPSVGAFYRFLPAWLRRTAAAALTLGTIGALGAILTVMAEDPGVRVPAAPAEIPEGRHPPAGQTVQGTGRIDPGGDSGRSFQRSSAGRRRGKGAGLYPFRTAEQ